MNFSNFISQTWTLTKKDLLLIARRRWFSTFIRAIAFPIVLTVIVSEVKHWIASNGGHGAGTPSPIRTLPEAFDYVGSTRPRFVIVDRGLQGEDVQYVINNLTGVARAGNRDVQTVRNTDEIRTACPSSSRGVTSCFGVVDIWSSPDSPNPQALLPNAWNYTLWQDSVLSGADVRRDDNPQQIYTLPLQRAVDMLISSRSDGQELPATVLQYPYTYESQAEVDFQDREFYGLLVTQALGFVLFLAMCGIAYHLTGHVVRQREQTILQLIDAQMPNKSRWESLVARMLATHLAFDIVYLPGWIVCGAVVGSIIYPSSNAGWFVLLYFLAGLAMTSFSLLASSLFQRQQLAGISATVAAIAFAIVAQFSQSGQSSTNNAAVTATGLLFPPAAFVYFLVSGAVSEIFVMPLQPNVSLNAFIAEYLDIRVWTLTPAAFLGFFVFQIVLYPILAIVIERLLWGSSFRGRHLKSAAEMDGNAVRISNFTKRYDGMFKKSDLRPAVDQLSLDLYAGSITVLLGMNGCGKSTTMSCIAGLQSITGGEISIDGSGGIGLCPQKNVMWPDMTVEEHVRFFQQLKDPRMSAKHVAAEVTRLIEGCDLSHKTHARSKTLSGGQQRKLQLAMMLAGGSKVCCIDEASSGIDPLARRKIWDILLRERGTRTLLLTTHFLDESEALADYIALMSKGKLRAEGTVSALKGSLGDGFRVILPQTEPSRLGDLGHRVTLSVTERATILHVPDGETLSPLLAKLEERDVADYKIQGPTIEKIFLRLADEMQMAEKSRNASFVTKDAADDQEKLSSDGSDIEQPPPASMALHTGRGAGPLKQTGALFRKRLTILKHNYMPYVAALFVPLVVAGLVTRFLLQVDNQALRCRDFSSASTYISIPNVVTDSYVGSNVYGPPSAIPVDRLAALVPDSRGFCQPPSRYSSRWQCYSSRTSYNQYQYGIEADSLSNFTSSVTPERSGGFFIDPNGPPVFAWRAGDSYMPASFIFQSALDMALTNMTIVASFETFATGYAPRDFFQSLVAVFTTLGFALFPGLFALYPTRERLQKVRAMHYSNGLSAGPLWTAYALFDFGFLLLIAVLTTVIWVAVSYDFYGIGYLFVVFLLYGMAAVVYSYIISLLAPSQLAAIAMTTIVQVVIAMLFFVGYFLTVDMADLTVIYQHLDYIYYTIALICPAVSLLRALMVSLNVYSLACNGENYASYPGGIELYGGPILYLTVQFFVFVLFLIWWESGRSLEAFGIKLSSRKSRNHDIEKEVEVVPGVTEESQRLSAANQGLRVQHISKTFKDNRAVDDVSFGVMPSEKFALLGPNGAGKSTMISLIRGDLIPDRAAHHSEIHITGDSLMQAPVAAKNHLGVCPQFDAVDSMTLKEHLRFYARARGVPKKEANENIAAIIHRLGLKEHENKLVKKLSGGTKRKLSLGIALVANPSVLLLDEPSSGMDAAAKRALWETLRTISADRCLLITTHSMEEADALCDRAGIMASKMLALGTISDLHERHGESIYVQIVHRDAPRSSNEEMEALWQWAQAKFLVSEREKSIAGQLRFSVPIRRGADAPSHLLDGSNLGRLYRVMEANKQEMGIREYGISEATLDQVFLNVVGRAGVNEENAHVVRKRGIVSKLLRR